jgi:medium-chain acyl-[acyl-carrier-protein] hydrolase
MEANVHNETFNLSAADRDDSELQRLLVLLDAMSETAGRHAEILGVGVRALHAKGLTWVLARLHVKITNVPAAGQTVHIATWPSGRHRLFAVREFRLTVEAGNEILRAGSAWALMNMETRRPSRLDPHLPIFTSHPERMVADDFAPLPPASPDAGRVRYLAQAGDIDINDHVNNTVYLDWALRDEVICLTEHGHREGGAALVQSLLDAASGRELTRLRTYWQTGQMNKDTI